MHFDDFQIEIRPRISAALRVSQEQRVDAGGIVRPPNTMEFGISKLKSADCSGVPLCRVVPITSAFLVLGANGKQTATVASLKLNQYTRLL